MDHTTIRRTLGSITRAFSRLGSPATPGPISNLPPPTRADLEFAAATAILGDLTGYRRSLETKRPAAADGSPLPWYTYPAIEYFNQLDARGLKVFEYGCGNSSLYWARKGAEVWSVEHDPAWHATMAAQAAGLKGLALRETREAYAKAVHEPGVSFDMIVVDGIWRPACAAEALQALAPHGVFLLDNADWYTDVADFLRQQGFFPIDFSGFGPCNPYCWTTTLLLPFRSPLVQRLHAPAPIGGVAAQHGENW
ncbi:MAG: class I SAM-dependent methyltransferase [Desulfovibrio sp.]|nr:class I SAM-dependent methyltransferase [Desulfovibrio sp.]